MNTQKWVELATSKDVTRFNLTSLYRDRTCIVATDGHRLHLSNGLEEVDPHYIDGTDATFPDYNQVLPKGEPCTEINLPIQAFNREFKHAIAALKSLISPLKRFDGPFMRVSLFINSDDELIVERDHSEFQFSLNLGAVETVKRGIVDRLDLNLKYLVDLLALTDDMPCTLKFYGISADALYPLELTGPKQRGIVMPTRVLK